MPIGFIIPIGPPIGPPMPMDEPPIGPPMPPMGPPIGPPMGPPMPGPLGLKDVVESALLALEPAASGLKDVVVPAPAPAPCCGPPLEPNEVADLLSWGASGRKLVCMPCCVLPGAAP